MRKRPLLLISLWVISIVFMLPAAALALGLAKCGDYEAEGLVRASSVGSKLDVQPVLVIEKDSKVETQVSFAPNERERLKKYLRTNVRIRFRLKKTCMLHCEASLVEIVRPLTPFQQPAGFYFPEPKPNPERPCEP